MQPSWTVQFEDYDFVGLEGPVPLARRRMGLPRKPAIYFVTVGDCVAHVGYSGTVSARLSSLADPGRLALGR